MTTPISSHEVVNFFQGSEEEVDKRISEAPEGVSQRIEWLETNSTWTESHPQSVATLATILDKGQFGTAEDKKRAHRLGKLYCSEVGKEIRQIAQAGSMDALNELIQTRSEETLELVGVCIRSLDESRQQEILRAVEGNWDANPRIMEKPSLLGDLTQKFVPSLQSSFWNPELVTSKVEYTVEQLKVLIMACPPECQQGFWSPDKNDQTPLSAISFLSTCGEMENVEEKVKLIIDECPQDYLSTLFTHSLWLHVLNGSPECTKGILINTPDAYYPKLFELNKYGEPPLFEIISSDGYEKFRALCTYCKEPHRARMWVRYESANREPTRIFAELAFEQPDFYKELLEAAPDDFVRDHFLHREFGDSLLELSKEATALAILKNTPERHFPLLFTRSYRGQSPLDLINPDELSAEIREAIPPSFRNKFAVLEAAALYQKGNPRFQEVLTDLLSSGDEAEAIADILSDARLRKFFLRAVKSKARQLPAATPPQLASLLLPLMDEASQKNSANDTFARNFLVPYVGPSAGSALSKGAPSNLLTLPPSIQMTLLSLVSPTETREIAHGIPLSLLDMELEIPQLRLRESPLSLYEKVTVDERQKVTIREAFTYIVTHRIQPLNDHLKSGKIESIPDESIKVLYEFSGMSSAEYLNDYKNELIHAMEQSIASIPLPAWALAATLPEFHSLLLQYAEFLPQEQLSVIIPQLGTGEIFLQFVERLPPSKSLLSFQSDMLDEQKKQFAQNRDTMALALSAMEQFRQECQKPPNLFTV